MEQLVTPGRLFHSSVLNGSLVRTRFLVVPKERKEEGPNLLDERDIDIEATSALILTLKRKTLVCECHEEERAKRRGDKGRTLWLWDTERAQSKKEASSNTLSVNPAWEQHA